MEDSAIVDLYFNRSERAVTETQNKYGRMIKKIAFGILKNIEDAEECESDTYIKTWETLPPVKPKILSAYLSKIARNKSLDRYEYTRAKKRGAGENTVVFDELEECIPDDKIGIDTMEDDALNEILNDFLGSLKKESRIIFMQRYWLGYSVNEIAHMSGCGESKIKMSLLRSRKYLKVMLETSGYNL